MEKFLRKYGIVLILYLVIVGGILLLNARCKMLNEQNHQATNIQIENEGLAFTK